MERAARLMSMLAAAALEQDAEGDSMRHKQKKMEQEEGTRRHGPL
jgi:hypothetical protein